MTIANITRPAYAFPVAANSATGFGDLEPQGGHRLQSGFFMSATWQACNGRAVWEAFGPAGFLVAGSPTCTVPPTRLATGGGQQHRTQENTAMTPRRTLTLVTPTPRIKAVRHRRMALAALKLDSSLSVRLSRYWSHIEKARALEAVGGAQ